MSTKARYTFSKAAVALGITHQAIGQIAKKPGAPVVAQGSKKFCLWPDFPVWYHAGLKAKDKPTDLAEAQQRRAAAEAELAELELAEKRGELALKTTVQQSWSRVMERVDAKLRGLVPLSARLFGAKTPAELQTKMEALVEEIREELRGVA